MTNEFVTGPSIAAANTVRKFEERLSWSTPFERRVSRVLGIGWFLGCLAAGLTAFEYAGVRYPDEFARYLPLIAGVWIFLAFFLKALLERAVCSITSRAALRGVRSTIGTFKWTSGGTISEGGLEPGYIRREFVFKAD